MKMLQLFKAITEKVAKAKEEKRDYIELTIYDLTKDEAQLIIDFITVALDCSLDCTNYTNFTIYTTEIQDITKPVGTITKI